MPSVVLGLLGLTRCDHQVILRLRASPSIIELVQRIFDGISESGSGHHVCGISLSVFFLFLIR